MDFLIFGPEKPKLSFRQDPEKGTAIRCDNEYMLDDYGPDKPITWRDVAWILNLFVNLDWLWHSVVKRLKTLCQTDAERKFLVKIATAQENWERFSFFRGKGSLEEANAETRSQYFESLLNKPALIPQVWLNWPYYDSRDKERAKRSHLEPFRVDFLCQGKHDNGVFKKVIVEIDDIGHIADVEGSADNYLVRPSLEKFTEHLRKDRWLRHHGWEVCRFSTLEAEKENSNHLYFEMMGGPEINRASPSYFPHKW